MGNGISGQTPHPAPMGQLDGALKQQWVARGLRRRWYQSAALNPHGHSGMLPMQTPTNECSSCFAQQAPTHTHGQMTTHIL